VRSNKYYFDCHCSQGTLFLATAKVKAPQSSVADPTQLSDTMTLPSQDSASIGVTSGFFSTPHATNRSAPQPQPQLPQLTNLPAKSSQNAAFNFAKQDRDKNGPFGNSDNVGLEKEFDSTPKSEPSSLFAFGKTVAKKRNASATKTSALLPKFKLLATSDSFANNAPHSAKNLNEQEAPSKLTKTTAIGDVDRSSVRGVQYPKEHQVSSNSNISKTLHKKGSSFSESLKIISPVPSNDKFKLNVQHAPFLPSPAECSPRGVDALQHKSSSMPSPVECSQRSVDAWQRTSSLFVKPHPVATGPVSSAASSFAKPHLGQPYEQHSASSVTKSTMSMASLNAPACLKQPKVDGDQERPLQHTVNGIDAELTMSETSKHIEGDNMEVQQEEKFVVPEFMSGLDREDASSLMSTLHRISAKVSNN
jgi:hypothetical protein